MRYGYALPRRKIPPGLASGTLWKNTGRPSAVGAAYVDFREASKRDQFQYAINWGLRPYIAEYGHYDKK